MKINHYTTWIAVFTAAVSVDARASFDPGETKDATVRVEFVADGDGEATAHGNIMFVGGPGHVLVREDADNAAFGEKRGWLGVSLTNVDEALATQLDLEEGGILITNVVKDSPAEQAGIEQHDVVTAIDGVALASIQDLSRQIGEAGPGATVTLTVLRGGNVRNITVTLGENQPRQRVMAWVHGDDIAGFPAIHERISTRGKVILQDADGEMHTIDLQNLHDHLADLPDSIRLMLPDLHDVNKNVWFGHDNAGTHRRIEIKINDNGEMLQINEDSDSGITVTRTTVDDNGDTTTTTNTYDTPEALEAADPDAFEAYSNSHGHGAHGVFDFSFGFDLDDMPDWQGMALNFDDIDIAVDGEWREQLEAAMERAHEAMADLPAAAKLKFGTAGPHAFAFHTSQQVQQSFNVNPDGSIEVRLLKGDSEVIMNYANEDDLARRNPDMYEKFLDVVEADDAQ